MFATCANPDSLWWQAQILLALENRDSERIDYLVKIAEAHMSSKDNGHGL